MVESMWDIVEDSRTWFDASFVDGERGLDFNLDISSKRSA